MFFDFLLSHNEITESQYNQVMASLEREFDGDTTKALLSVGLSEDQIARAKATFYNIPYQKVDPNTITSEVLKFVEESAAVHYKFVPIGFAEGVLSVGVTEPENIEAMNALQFISVKLEVPFKIFLISNADYQAILERYRTVDQEVDRAVTDLNDELERANKEVVATKQGAEKNASPQQEKIVEDAPIIKIVAVIINHAVEGEASDIHIENSGEAVKVRYRLDGILHTTLVLPLNTFDGIVARIKILSRLRLDEKRKPQDGSFFTMIEGRKIEFRVSTFPAYFGEKIVMRILDSEHGVRTIDQLDLTDDHKHTIEAVLKRPYGLVLISGPTGSGKTTTLYAMLNGVDREGSNVVSLEDPVEYQIPGVTQSQVMPEIGYTFATGLRSILRQDPNIIMVGEIRDKETAELAIQAALTGHLVLSTIHTNNSIGIVPRLIDMGIDPYLIAPTLILAMAQRLVRRVHPSARHQVPMDGVTRAFIDKEFADLDPKYRDALKLGDTMYETKPSSESPSMTHGRIAVFEMFPVDKDIQELILKSPSEQELYKAVRAKGMLTLREDALLKALRGEVLLQEVYGL
ncbi:MAG TPA: GspE/PulE family protein [Candidatus Paceibacterota bacterium]|nr:GspE/PulE family protein [Candidatus Paceibacterota bacterium]